MFPPLMQIMLLNLECVPFLIIFFIELSDL